MHWQPGINQHTQNIEIEVQHTEPVAKHYKAGNKVRTATCGPASLPVGGDLLDMSRTCANLGPVHLTQIWK